MYLKHVSFVKSASLQPGAICAFPLRGKLVYGMIGTTEDDFKEKTAHFVALRDEDMSSLGGYPLVNLQQIHNYGVFYLHNAYFIPEISEASLAADERCTRWIGMKGEETFLCLRQGPFDLTFSTLTGADSNTPIRDMIKLYKWKLESQGTDDKPITIVQC